MNRFFVASLVPIVLASAGLAWGGALRRRPGITALGLSLTAWSAALGLAAAPATRPIGDSLLMVGFFVPAAFLHAVLEDRGSSPRPALAFYAAGVGMTALGALPAGLFLRAGGTEPGPWFGPMFALASVLSCVPVAVLMQDAGIGRAPARDERARYLFAAALLGVVGGGTNILTTMLGTTHPAGLYLELASLALLYWIGHAETLPRFGRFLETSLAYTVTAAAVSALFFAGILALVPGDGGWLLLFLLTLLAQPVLARIRGLLARRFFPTRGDEAGAQVALAAAEAQLDHDRRLAEIGTLAAAVAHEVRNPVGVMSACVGMLRRQGADAELLGEISQQLDRTSTFAAELLEYARPAPPVRRDTDLNALVEVAAREVGLSLGALGYPTLAVSTRGAATLEADPAQLQRLFAVLFENATLAGASCAEVVLAAHRDVVVTVEDDGPGVADAVAARLFQPFASGRGRDGPRPGTGLGLAIARGIAERHQGSLTHLGGSRFQLSLPAAPRLPVEAG